MIIDVTTIAFHPVPPTDPTAHQRSIVRRRNRLPSVGTAAHDDTVAVMSCKRAQQTLARNVPLPRRQLRFRNNRRDRRFFPPGGQAHSPYASSRSRLPASCSFVGLLR